MNSVNFNAVNACFFAHFCRLTERIDKLFDFVNGHCTRRNFVAPTVRIRTCAHSELVDVDKRLCDRTQQFVGVQILHQARDCKRTTEARRELHEHFRTRFVDFIHKWFEMSERTLALVEPIATDDVSYRRNARQNETDVVLCSVKQEICGFFVEMMGFHPSED